MSPDDSPEEQELSEASEELRQRIEPLQAERLETAGARLWRMIESRRAWRPNPEQLRLEWTDPETKTLVRVVTAPPGIGKTRLVIGLGLPPKSHPPPIGAYRVLHALLPSRDRESIERDLEEQFEQDAQNPRIGPKLARFYYRWRSSMTLLWIGWDGALQQGRRVVELLNPLVELLRKLGPS